MIVVNAFESMGKGKYRAAFDNGTSCVLYRGEAARLSLEEGSVLTEEQVDMIIEEIVGKRAKKRAMYLLEKMDRTEHQLREKLSNNEYPQICIDNAIEYVKSYNYLDDYRYACNFIRFQQEKLGRQQIMIKLIQKGIDKELINIALEEEYSSDELSKIQMLLKKRRFDPESDDEKEFQRTYQYIMRRGFKSSDVLKVMRKKDYY